ncbi:NADH-quinone oxidoreductase subunit NuoN [Arenibaculum pallidiluteum]|uniref:NADH-quinone oxidoreductase subunit NuoN n=1 Tax=Arenibaculum pallidiluteum TaxID=2812559 RepID=UPI001A9647D2|nr:NADH-quinone oxidoreductase subunit NuoN [Arenibaculum pallidiluteum]
MAQVPNLIPALPEIFLAVAAMALLMLGVFRGDGSTRLVSWLSVAALVVAGGLVLAVGGPREVTLSGLFVMDRFGVFMKLLVLLGSALTLILSMTYVEREQMSRVEYPVLIVLSTTGMLMMVSANDLISLYVGLETQSLAAYVIAAFRRDSARSSEAGLKYFVLGALSSGMLLYGSSLVYGFAGSTGFDRLAAVLAAGSVSTGLLVGLVFVAAGVAFKLSAVPFHMWTPDVYEGSPTSVTAFFAVAPKVAAVALFVRLLIEPFGSLVEQWRQIVWFMSVGSMLLGSFAAIGQSNIKRLMAYSSIGHVGYALVGLAAGSELGVRGVMFYLAIYIFMNIGAFAVILCMRQNGRAVEGIQDLSGLSKSHPMLALAMAIFMFSMAGIPPNAGFFAKLFVFQAAIEAQLYVLAVIGVLSSVVGAYYYLRIVKVMYFDDAVEPLDRAIPAESRVLVAATALFTLLFFFVPAPLLEGAANAASSLFAG